MRIKRIVVGPIMTNCYLVNREDSDAGIIIDPGDNADKIADASRQAGVTPRLVVNTHAHFDHIGGNAGLKRHFPGLKFAVGAIDADSMADPMQNLGAGFGGPEKPPPADQELHDGETIGMDGCTFRVHHTPGHTSGSISLVAVDESPPVVFCGDLIFEKGVGRTDLPGGNAGQLRQSIRDLLDACPDEAILYPGHGPSVTIKERKEAIGDE